MIEVLSEDNLKAVVREYLGLTRKRLRLSHVDMQNLLQSDLPGAKVSHSEGFPVGGPNELYRAFLEDSEQELVLKIVNKGAESGHDGYFCAREAFALSQASASHPAFPSVCAAHPDGGELGRPYFVMTCLRGQPLWWYLWSNTGEISQSEIRRIGREVGKAVANLHEVVFDQHGDLPVPGQPAPKPHYQPLAWGMSGDIQETYMKRVDFVLRLYNVRGILCSTDCGMIEAALHKKAKELLSSESPPSLIHGDLDLKNILILRMEGKWCLSGLVDFDKSLALPREAELGFMESRWTTNTSAEHLEIYSRFKRGFLEGYESGKVLLGEWEARVKLFFALQSLERIHNKGARMHLYHYVDSV